MQVVGCFLELSQFNEFFRISQKNVFEEIMLFLGFIPGFHGIARSTKFLEAAKILNARNILFK